MARSFLRTFAAASSFALGASLFVGALLSRRRRWYSLRGKNALVTGGARGLGLEIARILVAKGANVAIVSRDEAEIARALVDLRAVAEAAGSDAPDGKVRVSGHRCDLRDGPAIDAMLAEVQGSLGPIDVLVNNAGSIQVGPLDAMTIEDFESAMKLHCFAPLRIMLALRETMRARGGGRIANIASIGGLVSVPHLLPYSTSKFALIGLSQGMGAELSRDGIFVSTIAPGLMRTGSPRRALFKGDHEKEFAWFAISDSLPLLSMASDRAARRIVSALEHGEAHLVLGMPGKLAAFANGIAPGLVTRLLTVVSAMLPQGSDRRERPGYQCESPLAPSFLTALTDGAAAKNNEY